MSKTTIIIVLVAVLGGMALTCVGGVAALLYLSLNPPGGFGPPQNITVAVNAPSQAPARQPFQITVDVTNTATTTQNLNSIDIYDGWHDGFVISQTTPATTSKIRIMDFTSYFFEKDIPPGQTLTVTFDVTPTTVGSYTGDWDICINTEYSFMTQTVHTQVQVP